MPVSKLMTSGLEKVVSELPEDFSMKSSSVGNFLTKKGAKPEELEYSRIASTLPEKATKADLTKAVKERPDNFNLVPGGKDYTDITLDSAKNNPTYRENVYTFREATPEAQEAIRIINNDNATSDEIMSALPKVEETASNYTSSHFPDVPNYLFHTRTYTAPLKGTDTHVITELQSDLHQAKLGGVETPKSPLAKNTERKAIEHELAYAAENGLAQVAIPIKDAGPLFNHKDVEAVIAKYKAQYDNGEDVSDLIDDLKFDQDIDLVAEIEKDLKKAGINIIDFDYSDVRDLWQGEGTSYLANRVLPKSGIDTTDSLARSSGVQKNYESTVANVAKKIAKTNGLTFETVTDKGVEYAVIKLDGKQPKFSLYASPVAGGFAVYQAMQLGASEEQIKESMTRNGYDEEDYAEMYDTATKIKQAVAQGIPEAEVRAYLEKQNPTLESTVSEPTQPVKNYFTESEQEFNRRMDSVASLDWVDMHKAKVQKDAYTALNEQELSAAELVNNLEVIYPTMASIGTRLSGFFGNLDDARTAEQASNASKQQIINAAAKENLNIQYDPKAGKYFLVTPQGEQDITPSLWKEIWREKGDTAGSIAGGIAGFKAGMKVPGHPFVKGAAAIFGSMGGAAAGAAAGTTADYLWSAMQTSEDLDAQVAAHKALTAAQVSALGDFAVGSGIVTGKAFWRGSMAARDYLLAGNPAGARKALKESLFVTDEEAADMLSAMQRVSEVPGKLKSEQTIAAAVLSKPGLEGLARAASSLDAKTSMAIAKGISDRAADVIKTANDMSDPNLASTVIADLRNYQYDVKDFYRRVKEVPAKSPFANNFQFNYDKLALEPALERVGKNIIDKTVNEQFLHTATLIRNYSTTRSLTDLLELRQLVNDFKFNTKIKNTKDFGMLNEVLTRIDKEIVTGAKATIPNSTEWLNTYGKAKASYAEMKRTENNVLYKALTRPGVNTNTVVRRLARDITAADGTFDEVMSKLPKVTKQKVEGSVLDVLVDKYSAGATGGTKAINFPALAKDLENISFTTPEARKFKRAMLTLSDVFKNDVPLAAASGRLQVQPFQSFLTSDPVVRAEFAFASSVFNHIRRLKPTAEGNRIALALKTADVLENPLKTKAVKELMEEASGDMEVTNALQEYMRQYVNKGDTGTKIALFGDGKLLSFKGIGERVSIAVDKIATTDVARRVAEADGFNINDTKALDYALKSRGYKAIQVGTEKVRRIN